jgi:hypothetical protein
MIPGNEMEPKEKTSNPGRIYLRIMHPSRFDFSLSRRMSAVGKLKTHSQIYTSTLAHLNTSTLSTLPASEKICSNASIIPDHVTQIH